MNKLAIFTRNADVYLEKLAKLDLPDLEIVEDIAEANIILGIPWMVKPHLKQAKNLQWFQSSFAGIDALVGEGLRDDYILTNVKDTYGDVMAEYVLAYILYFEKEIAANLGFQSQKKWAQRPFATLEGRKICILGTGSIAKQIARILKVFACEVYGYRTKDEAVEYFDKIFTAKDFEEFLGVGDYIVNVLPCTKDTDNLIDAKAFASMKESAVFINVGRGNAVNEGDLVDAMQRGLIANAVLDVFKNEPLAEDSPLWNLNNVYITPHVSGYILNDRIFEIFEANYRRFIDGEDLLYRVDMKKGY